MKNAGVVDTLVDETEVRHSSGRCTASVPHLQRLTHSCKITVAWKACWADNNGRTLVMQVHPSVEFCVKYGDEPPIGNGTYIPKEQVG